MLEADTHAFIAAEYLPPRMTIKDPRNMTKGQILNFLANVDEREKRYGIQDGFRFHSYYNGTEMVPAEYPIEVGEPAQQAAGIRPKKARAAKKSRKGKEKELLPPSDSARDSRGPNAARLNTRQPNAAGPASDSNIDPSLLAPGTVPPQSSDDDNAPEPTIRRIGETEMTVLVNLGHPPVLPINGPNDGLPQYEVASAAYQLFISKLVAQPKEQGPKSRGRPRKSQNNAEDSQGMAHSITNPAKNTRSRSKKDVEPVKKGTQSGTRRSTRQKK